MLKCQCMCAIGDELSDRLYAMQVDYRKVHYFIFCAVNIAQTWLDGAFLSGAAIC